MSDLLHIALGLGLALIGWLILRVIARAGRTAWIALLLDLAPVLWGWGVFFAATARPGFAGAVILTLACGLAIADWTKRLVLREPIVFSDSAELSQVFTNPELYLPFAPRGLLYGGGAVLILGAASLVPLEPGVWSAGLWQPLVTFGASVALIWAMSRPPWLPAEAAWLKRNLPPSGDPIRDCRTMGPLACLLIYGTIARAERPSRLAGVRPADGVLDQISGPKPPIIVIQSESFFDARRLHPGIAEDLLPCFDALSATSLAHGQFVAPGWGANTMRSEFAVLTGLDEATIGFDRFNPYHRFALTPVNSLAWALQRQGYKTICVHPYSRRFYRRDLVLPMLGFDEYVSIEAFTDAERINGFVSDVALARFLVDRLHEDAEPIFLFAMTMENHGPWQTDPAGPSIELAPGLPTTARLKPLRRYLASLRNADRMLSILSEALTARGDHGLLGFYGDHLPSLADAFDDYGFEDSRTDYLVWSPDGSAGSRQVMAAHELAGFILAQIEPVQAPTAAELLSSR
jgi:hypothetical protein